MGGDITVVDDGDIVSASRGEPPVELPPTDPAPPEPEPETPVAEPETTPPVEAAETPTETPTERDDKGRFKKPIEKKTASLQAEINRLTYERREEERRLSQIQERRKQLETPAPTPEPVKADGPSSFEDFAKDYQAKHPENTSYERIVDAFQTVRDARLKEDFRRELAQEAENKALDEAWTSHLSRMEDMIAATPQWDARKTAADAYMAQRGFQKLPDTMSLAILRSPSSEKIMAELVQHPEFAYQVAVDAKDLPSTPAAVNMVRTVLESRLGNAMPAPSSGPGTAVRQSRSYEPPKPVGTTPLASASSDDEPSYDQMLDRVTKILHPKR